MHTCGVYLILIIVHEYNINHTLFLFCRPHQLLTVRNCIRSLYRTDGIRAFYRGLTASYAGTIETAIHFVIYERMKVKVAQLSGKREPHPTECMFIAAGSKMTASMLCYPHGKWLLQR